MNYKIKITQYLLFMSISLITQKAYSICAPGHIGPCNDVIDCDASTGDSCGSDSSNSNHDYIQVPSSNIAAAENTVTRRHKVGSQNKPAAPSTDVEVTSNEQASDLTQSRSREDFRNRMRESGRNIMNMNLQIKNKRVERRSGNNKEVFASWCYNYNNDLGSWLSFPAMNVKQKQKGCFHGADGLEYGNGQGTSYLEGKITCVISQRPLTEDELEARCLANN